MAEPLAGFVARRRPEWTRLESMLRKARSKSLSLAELTELDGLYRRLASDLAIAQSAYAGTDVHRFLNQLSVTAHATIHRPARANAQSIRQFYVTTFPALVRQTREVIFLAAAVMLFGALLGATSIWLQPNSVRWLVEPALREGFIDRGILWTDSVLGSTTPTDLAVGIFLNNLRVLFMAFALGITAGVGTLFVLLTNGLQIGAVLVACFRGGVGPNLLSFITAHGPIELSLIAISGGAGLHLARAMVMPGERTRGTALRENAQVAVQLVLGCAPFIVAIGIVEGFVSPGNFFPWPLKLAIGALSFFAFWRYLDPLSRRGEG